MFARLSVNTHFVVLCFNVKLASSLHDKYGFIDKQDVVELKCYSPKLNTFYFECNATFDASIHCHCTDTTFVYQLAWCLHGNGIT